MTSVLVVDDRRENRDFLVTLLGYRGFRVLEAGDGIEALELARQEPLQLVIADVLMPRMDGCEFVRQLRSEPQVGQVPVIFYTAACVEDDWRSLALSCGVEHILVKPCEPEEVLRVIDIALGSAPGAPLCVPDEEFRREHLRVLANKLTSKVEELERVNGELREAQRLAQRASEEKTVLLREVHHRVKNNLQIITSLLHLQAHESSDSAVHRALAECQGRVRAMAMIHELLYERQNFARIELGEYLERLAGMVMQLSGVQPERVSLQLDLEPIDVDLAHAVPCGLLANELLTNSFKHAFPDGRCGSVSLSLEVAEGGTVLLRVGDDGVGLPQGVQPDGARSLGLKLVSLLAEQVGGQLTLQAGSGTSFEVSFQADSGARKT